mmetsp:Transcript_33872/g.87877  ORF Transcript_33872/g.87877 Transcript_33872/m.87877 type:complete len:169 (+) Transcript_33872:1968-2474(+)
MQLAPRSACTACTKELAARRKELTALALALSMARPRSVAPRPLPVNSRVRRGLEVPRPDSDFMAFFIASPRSDPLEAWREPEGELLAELSRLSRKETFICWFPITASGWAAARSSPGGAPGPPLEERAQAHRRQLPERESDDDDASNRPSNQLPNRRVRAFAAPVLST